MILIYLIVQFKGQECGKVGTLLDYSRKYMSRYGQHIIELLSV